MARITGGVGMVSDRKSILSRAIDEVRIHETTPPQTLPSRRVLRRGRNRRPHACLSNMGVPARLESSHRKAGADVVGGFSFRWFISDCR